MVSYRFAETDVELAALHRLGEVGYAYAKGPDLAFNDAAPVLSAYHDIILDDRLRDTLLPKLITVKLRLPGISETMETIAL